MHFITTRARWGLSILLIATLSACSSVSTTDEPDTGKMQFELSGRLGIRQPGQSDQAQVFWRHGERGDWVRLEGPLGQTVATIANLPEQAVLTTSEKTWQANSAEALTEEVLGWPLPLSGMSNWILGRADKSERSGPFSQQTIENIPQLEQAGWTIRYLLTDTTTGLPKKIELQRGELQIKVIVDEWSTAADLQK